MSDTEHQESWAIVELMGHVTMAGRLSEEERFGSKVGRIDIPTNEGGFTTVFFGGSSIYRVTPTSEAIARAKARSNQPKPIYAYELPKAEDHDPVKAIVGPRDDYDPRNNIDDDDYDPDDSRDMDL